MKNQVKTINRTENFIKNVGYLENLYITFAIFVTVFLIDLIAFKYSIPKSLFYSVISLIIFYVINSLIFFILHPLFTAFSKKTMKEVFLKVTFLELLYIFIGLLTSIISLLIGRYALLLLITLVLINISIWILFSYLFSIVYEIKASQAFFSLIVLVTFLLILIIVSFLSFNFFYTYPQPLYNM